MLSFILSYITFPVLYAILIFFMYLIHHAGEERVGLKLISIYILAVTTFLTGFKISDLEWKSKVSSAQEKIAIKEQESKEANIVIKEVYVDRPIEIVRERTKEVIKKIPVIVKEQNESCIIDNSIVDVHNDVITKTNEVVLNINNALK